MYPPPGPSSEAPSRWRYRRRRSIIWPALLIGAGLVFLLQNAGILSWNAWGWLWRFWPVILILLGLELFLEGRVRSRQAVLLAGLVLLVVLGLSFAGAGSSFAGAHFGRRAPVVQTQTRTQPLGGAKQADVVLHVGAGNLDLGALPAGSGNLARMSYSGPGSIQAQYALLGNGVGHLTYGANGGAPRWFFGGGSSSDTASLNLNPDVPLTLNVYEGASNAHLDLSQLQVTSLTLQVGASHGTLILPEGAGTTTVNIKGGASTIDIQVPTKVAARIRYQGGLSQLNVDQSRFPSAGSRTFESKDYATAKNRADIFIQAGVATVNVT